jgi:hypothetical protein
VGAATRMCAARDKKSFSEGRQGVAVNDEAKHSTGLIMGKSW